jgi:hypothetical protein
VNVNQEEWRMGFRFEKLYADVVAQDGTVCIAYLAWLDVWGLKSAYAGLELYWPDGRREVIQAQPRAEPIDWSRREIHFSFDVPGGPFLLEYRVVHGAWTPEGAPCDDLRWCVKAARAEASGRWMGDPRRPVLRGVGYADWVELDRPTRRLNLGLLRWGRVHLPDATLVFNAVDFRSGPPWQRAARWSDAGRAEYGTVGIERASSGTEVHLAGLSGHLIIEPARALHVGDAIDRARFPGAVERLVSSAVTGPATERRLLGRARWTGQEQSGSAWALHEAVRFGPLAAVVDVGTAEAPRP